MLFSKFTPRNPMRSWGGKNEVLCADLGISCTSLQSNFWVILPLTPLPMGVGLLNFSCVHFYAALGNYSNQIDLILVISLSVNGSE